MDNCSIHKGKEISALIQAAGAKLIYLPPYSPDFSRHFLQVGHCPPNGVPYQLKIEKSKIKNILRSIGARNYPYEREDR